MKNIYFLNMNDNMANFQKKIEEMQRKLNIINEDIEEIKNGRKSYDKNHKIKINKSNIFLNSHKKRKNFFRDNINNNNNVINNNSINYFYKKNLTKSEYCTDLNNTGRPMYHFKNYNLTNKHININEIPNNGFFSNEIYNSSSKINNNNNNELLKRDLTINYIDDYTNKKNNNFIKKYKSSLSTINVNDGKQLHFQYGNNINNFNKNNETDEYFYKNNSLFQNYCHMKKNLNNINANNLNNSQIINKDNISKNNKTFSNNTIIKDLSPFTEIKNHKKIKRILVDKKKKNSSNEDTNFFNHEVNMKINKKNKKNNYNDNNHKTIDINYNNSFNKKNLIFNNIKSNGPIKIKTRNNNNNISNIMNDSKNDIIQMKVKSNTVEDINIKNPRSMSIENPKVKIHINNHYKHNKNIRLNDIHNLQDNLLFKYKTNTYHNHNPHKNENEKINNENKKNYEKMIFDIIDITNQYYNLDDKANTNNIIDEYKILLYDTKVKNEFIYKIINLYNNTTNSNLSINSNESLIPIWNWIKDNQNKADYNKIKNETKNKQYKKLCKDIMKEYNLKNIEQLKLFIHKLCKKVDKNENFLEGIKKILLP